MSDGHQGLGPANLLTKTTITHASLVLKDMETRLSFVSVSWAGSQLCPWFYHILHGMSDFYDSLH